MQNDHHRMQLLLKYLVRPDHPLAASSGGKGSRTCKHAEGRRDTHTAIKHFYDTFYSANLMKLVVSGKGKRF